MYRHTHEMSSKRPGVLDRSLHGRYARRMPAEVLRPEQIDHAFEARGFVCPAEVGTALFLAETLGKPLLLEGPPGVGKTEIGKLWAAVHDLRLLRLQCYEGLD